MKYDVIIGLEIHAELKTKSKMFCGCDNDSFGQAPNVNVCPICLGHPGTLPRANQQAIDWTILTGLALNCQINKLSKFDRKNYFYPDLPKGYQISQFDLPFCFGGQLTVGNETVAITRIHLEEDTGKLSHPEGADYSLADFNRVGTPLMELVTEPVIHDGATAKKFCQTYQQILRALNVSNADMEKGEMRCEANVSLQIKDSWQYQGNGIITPIGKAKLNPKVEVKNINSFRSLEKAIDFEIARQTQLLDVGELIAVETRGWDDVNNITVSQRVKETSADYHYFPEPDLPPLAISDKLIDELRARLPELPAAKLERFKLEYGLGATEAEILTADDIIAKFTEATISELGAWTKAEGLDWEKEKNKLTKLTANWLINELFKHLRLAKLNLSQIKITPENFAELITLIYLKKINSTAGQKILEIMYQDGSNPTEIMVKLNLGQMDDTVVLEKIVQQILAQFPEQVAQYQNGKAPLLQFLIGKVMAQSKGQANPQTVEKLIKEILKQ